MEEEILGVFHHHMILLELHPNYHLHHKYHRKLALSSPDLADRGRR
jgi:hypothetical protein